MKNEKKTNDQLEDKPIKDINSSKSNKIKNTSKIDINNKQIKWKIFKIIIFVILAAIIIGIGVAVGIVTDVISKTDNINLDDLKLLKLTTFVYDKDSNVIATEYDTENRVSVEYKEIPTDLVNAIVSIEDERFFSHKGIDLKRTAGAIVNYILNKGSSSYGGSTLTQQLVKNLTDDKEVVWTRKIREWYRAISLEKMLSKEEIFQAYANTIYLGDGAYGVEVASENYFGKSVKDLTLPECAVIAAIIQSPEKLNPYLSDESRKELLERQKLVLSQMLKLNKITQDQYNQAVNAKLEFKSKDSNDSNIQSYYVDAVINKVVDDLKSQKNISNGVALQMIYTGGLKIYTPYDSNVQNAIDNAYNNDKLFYNDSDGEFMQSAMVVMDQYTGNVLGLIGGAGKKTGNRVLNRAVDGVGQPGSTMKPFAAYGPAFEQGIAGPDTIVNDSPISVQNWTPHNYYNWYNGYVTIRQALAKSMNLPAIRTLKQVGIDYAYNFAKNCGITDLIEEDKTLPLAIGGITGNFTVLEMADAYATIANGGIHMTPKLYTKVLDNKGNVLLQADNTSNRAMKDTTSYMLTDTLKGVVKSGGTAYGYVKVGNMPIAGKTGETDSNREQWFIGYSPYYTIACWNGYDNNKSITRKYPYLSITLFNTVMNAISQNQEVKDFEVPQDFDKKLLYPYNIVDGFGYNRQSQNLYNNYNYYNYYNYYNKNQVKVY